MHQPVVVTRALLKRASTDALALNSKTRAIKVYEKSVQVHMELCTSISTVNTIV